MVPEQVRHEAAVASVDLDTDGRTPNARLLANRMLTAASEAHATNAEGIYACAGFLSTCLDGLTIEQQMVLLAATGNIAMSLHAETNAAKAAAGFDPIAAVALAAAPEGEAD